MLLKLQKIKTGFLNKRIMYHASFCLTNFFVWLTFNRWISTLRMLIQRLNSYFCITRHFLWRTSLFCSNVASCIWVDSTWLTRIFQTHTPAKVTFTSVDAELFLRARLSFFFWLYNGDRAWNDTWQARSSGSCRSFEGLQVIVGRSVGDSRPRSFDVQPSPLTGLEWTEQYVHK